jgi:hypothetical protein
MRARMLVGVVVGSILVTSVVVGTGPAQALTSTEHPQLTLDRLIRTSPFPGTSTRVFDNEGSAYVAGDNALWMADDQSDALLEVDRTTGALRRRIPQAAFISAQSVGGGPTAGQSRNEDLEALAYDADADVLYAFSGVTPWGPPGQRQPSFPTVYRLTRVAGEFQVASWRALPSEWTGAGWRAADGRTYVASRSNIRTYDYTTNTLGAPFSIPGLSKILGIDFDGVTGDLLAVNIENRLYRASMASTTLRAGWAGISLTGLGLRDTRAVEVIGEQLFVSDGADARVRPTTDPMSHAVFVLDVTTDTTDPTITIARPPAGAVYVQNQVVTADFSCADTVGGTGVASCVGTVADGQAVNTATLGQKTFRVTATDRAGNTRVLNRNYTVTPARPDGRIRRGAGPLAGDGIYNTTGVGQTRRGSAARGRSVTYYASIQNDGRVADTFRLRGQASTRRFAVVYRNPAGANITNAVTNGTYRTPNLATAGTHRITIIVTVRNAAPHHAWLARTLTATSTIQPASKDTVRFIIRRP